MQCPSTSSKTSACIPLTSPTHVQYEINNTRNQERDMHQSLKHLKTKQTKMLIFPLALLLYKFPSKLSIHITQSCGERALARLRPAQGGAVGIAVHPADQIHSTVLYVYQIAPRPVDLCCAKSIPLGWEHRRFPQAEIHFYIFKAPALDEEFSPSIVHGVIKDREPVSCTRRRCSITFVPRTCVFVIDCAINAILLCLVVRDGRDRDTLNMIATSHALFFSACVGRSSILPIVCLGLSHVSPTKVEDNKECGDNLTKLLPRFNLSL